MDSRYSSIRLEQLKDRVKNLNKLNRNWEQRVIGWVGVSENAKNNIIKNTKMRLLKKFLNSRPLPKNWENRVRTNFSNVNKTVRNRLVNAIKKEKFSPEKKSVYYIPSLQRMIISKMRRRNNQPQSISVPSMIRNFGKGPVNIGSREIPLSRMNIFYMKPSAKNMLKRANSEQYQRLINHAHMRGVQLHRNTYIKKNSAPRSNKNYLNRIGMINKIYTPNDPKYRRVISDVFAYAYKLIQMKKKYENHRRLIYPPLSFRAPFPGNTNRTGISRYNVTNIEFRGMEVEDDLEWAVKRFRNIFMQTPVLHVPKHKPYQEDIRFRLWETIEECKGTMASCVKKCNKMYYAALKRRSPHSVRITF
jgi:hypothetical protein